MSCFSKRSALTSCASIKSPQKTLRRRFFHGAFSEQEVWQSGKQQTDGEMDNETNNVLRMLLIASAMKYAQQCSNISQINSRTDTSASFNSFPIAYDGGGGGGGGSHENRLEKIEHTLCNNLCCKDNSNFSPLDAGNATRMDSWMGHFI